MVDDGERGRHRVREAALAGASAGPGPRSQVAASWRRVAACGVDPGGGPEIEPLGEAELERRRTTSQLAEHLPRLTSALSSAVDAGQLVVVSDSDGRVLWRVGNPGVRRMADRLGFVGGSAWTEGNVGTNAIGTALVLGEPVQIRGAEHYVESHTSWGCAAAPVIDPWTGRALGVVDVSGPWQGLHPAELGLVTLAARLSGLQAVEERRAALDRLRAVAAPIVARVTGRALVVDHSGHAALATGMEPPDRVTLPDTMDVGAIWLPTLGAATAEPLPGGWLLRLAADLGDPEAGAASLVLDLRGDPVVRVAGPSGAWSHDLTPRHAELLVALLAAGEGGRTAAGLAQDLFADPSRVVTVRAEMSRLRRSLGAVLRSQPYRVAPAVRTLVELPADRSLVLPGSSAPVVRTLRS